MGVIQMTKLEEFKIKAKELGSQMESSPSFSDEDRRFDTWQSADNGGCGTGDCHCSPGLWITASEGKETVIAHFGSDWGRGGYGNWTRDDYKSWMELSEFSKNLKG